jgi:hypothetical protein
MHDFSKPGISNIYKVPHSDTNYIQPGKRPVTSMTPAIFLDKNSDIRLMLSGAGGNRILSSLAHVSWKTGALFSLNLAKVGLRWTCKSRFWKVWGHSTGSASSRKLWENADISLVLTCCIFDQAILTSHNTLVLLFVRLQAECCGFRSHYNRRFLPLDFTTSGYPQRHTTKNISLRLVKCEFRFKEWPQYGSDLK